MPEILEFPDPQTASAAAPISAAEAQDVLRLFPHKKRCGILRSDSQGNFFVVETSSFFKAKKNGRREKKVRGDKPGKIFDVLLWQDASADRLETERRIEICLRLLRREGLVLIKLPESDGSNTQAWVQKGFSCLDRDPPAGFHVFALSGTVDIIIPIHNALDVFKPCLESVLQHTRNIPYRLVLINDASCEPAIDAFCRQNLRQGDLYFRHRENLGFVKSVNEGMRASRSHDVLLLNTDTVVSPGWLARILHTVLRDPRIAGATPLSNYASIYSIHALSSLPREEEISAIASSLADFDGERLIDIPTAVGFCFYIRRKALRQIGFFDEAFGLGYGEENDFCMRALKRGWRIILAHTAYVFHHGHVSMRRAGHLREDQTCLPEKEALLVRKHVDYPRRVADFLKTNPMSALRPRTLQRIGTRLAAGRRRILYLLHNSPNGKHIGGTEFHVGDLVRGLRDKHACYVAYVRDSRLIVEEYVGPIGSLYSFPVESNPGRFPLDSDAVYKAVRHILVLFQIELVHVHHLMGLGPSVIHAAKDRGLQVLMTLHDFYTLSPDHSLMHRSGRASENPQVNYEPFFLAHHGFEHFCSSAWRTSMGRALERVDLFFSPSNFVREVFRAEYPRTCAHEVREHGYEITADTANEEPQTDPADHFSVCFLGGVHEERKGKYLIEQILGKSPGGRTRFHLLGTSSDFWPRLTSAPHVIIHGFYERDQALLKIREIRPHIIALLSLSGEMYGYTLTEAWAAGIPVITGPEGALAERIRRHGGGILLPDLTVQCFLEAVERLQSCPEQYAALKESVRQIRLKSLAENIAEYEADYLRLLPAFSPEALPGAGAEKIKQLAHEAWLIAAPSPANSATPLQARLTNRLCLFLKKRLARQEKSRPPLSAAAAPAPEPQIQAPLFIVGMAKSGTSYLRNILNAHPKIFLEMEQLNRFWEAFVCRNQLQAEAEMSREYAAFWNLTSLRHPHKKYIGDKICFGNTAYMRAWARLFLMPQSKMIVLTRDPRDRIVSFRYHFTNRDTGGPKNWFYQPNWQYPDDDQPWWQDWLPEFRNNRALIIPYKELFLKPEETTLRILEYLNLPKDRLLAAHMVRRANTSAQLPFHINPIRRGMPGAWKKKLLPDECCLIKKLFQPLGPAVIPEKKQDWEFEVLETLRLQYAVRFLFLRFRKLRSMQFWRWVRRNRVRHAWLSVWWTALLDYEDPLMKKTYYPLRSLALPLDWIRQIVRLQETAKLPLLKRLLAWTVRNLFQRARKKHTIPQDFSATKLICE